MFWLCPPINDSTTMILIFALYLHLLFQEKKSPCMSRHWLVDSNHCHYEQKTRINTDKMNKKQEHHRENLTRSMVKTKNDRSLTPSLTPASPSSLQLAEDLEYDDLLLQTYSTDLKLENETAQMIYQDISEHKLSDKNSSECPDSKETEKNSLCKSVSVLKACQVLRLSDTSYCIRLANKQRSIRGQKAGIEK